MLSVVLAVVLLQTAPAAAGGNSPAAAPPSPPQQQQQQQQHAQPPQQPPPTSSSATSPVSDLFSIDHIRRELERQPALSFAAADPTLPRYRVRIEGYGFELPSWQKNFVLPHSPVPQPLGGSDFYEMQRLNTAPQAWGSAPFSNSDLLKMYGLTGAYGLAGALIKKGLEARENAAAARARAEVQQELADLAAHNAQVAAGQAGDGTTTSDAKKAAEKKKQDEAAKKKKKKDGGK